MNRRFPRVLIVDDDELIRRALGRMLRNVAEVHFAGDPAEARTKIAAFPFDAVVADEVMPGGRGTSILEEVRREHPECRRILMTGFGPSHGGDDPAHDVLLVKPFSRDELLAALGI